MSVRCKFKVENVEPNGDEFNITMRAVTSGSPENEEFFRWTPAGQLTFYTVNKAAAAQLELGKDYYLDITPAGS